jgi:hypothetical protein
MVEQTACRVWSKIEKILKLLNKLDVRRTLTPQQILFHKGYSDHLIIGLIIAGKHALTLLMQKVASNPINERVIDAFTKASAVQLCETYIVLFKNAATWLHLKSMILYVLNDLMNSGS